MMFFSTTTLSINAEKSINNREPTINSYNLKEEEDALDPKIDQIIEDINETIIEYYLTKLVEIGPRSTGTYGCDKAAEYIHREFTKLGLETRYQYWESMGPYYRFHYFKSQNVEAVLPGTDPNCDEVIIFGAHYDTTTLSPGGNDDGSGVAAVMTAAKILSQYEFKRTIKFLTFSGEEVYLLGSRAYAEEQHDKNTNILMMFNADMIGRAITEEGGKNMGISYTEDAEWTLNQLKQLSSNIYPDFTIRTGKIQRYGRGYSDYYHFATYGYETLALWGSSDGDPNMHTPNDTLENVNFSYLIKTTKLITGTIATIADSTDPHPTIRIVNPKRGWFTFRDRPQFRFKHNMTMMIDRGWIIAETNNGETPIEKVEFYYDGELVFTDYEKPYMWRIEKISKTLKKHSIEVKGYDEQERTCWDEQSLIYIRTPRE